MHHPDRGGGDASSSEDDQDMADTRYLVAHPVRKITRAEWRRRCRNVFKCLMVLGSLGVISFYLISSR